jgi:hypothetical protein
LFSKLKNNKTKCDLKTSTKKTFTKKISILFNLLFYDVIVSDISKEKRCNKIEKLRDGGAGDLVAKGQPQSLSANNSGPYLTEKEKENKIKLLVDNYNKNQKNLRGKKKLKNFILRNIIIPRMSKNIGVKYAKNVLNSIELIDTLFPNSKDKIDWRHVVKYAQSLHKNVRRNYEDIYPVVQQPFVGSCWINAILVSLMYSYELSEKLKIVIKEQRNSFEYIVEKNSLARIIPNALDELLILQYRSNANIKVGNQCSKREKDNKDGSNNCHISVDLNFVRNLITLLTLQKPGLFLQFSAIIEKKQEIQIQIQKDMREKALTLYTSGWKTMKSIDYIVKDIVVTIIADEEALQTLMKRTAVGATGVVGYVSGYAGKKGQICKKLSSGNALVKFKEGNTCAFPWDVLLVLHQQKSTEEVETVQTQSDVLDNTEQVVADEQILLKSAHELFWNCTMPDEMKLTYVTPDLEERYAIALEDARITMKEEGAKFLRSLELNEVLLNKGGTLRDTLNLIYILLVSGLGFNFIENYDNVKTYTKYINKDESRERITICIIVKNKSQNYEDIIQLPEFTKYKLASMILWNYNKDIHEDMHTISVVTDYNNQLYYYNGLLNNNIVNPLKKVLNNNIDVGPYKFSLSLSFGIIFMLNVKKIS